MIERGAASAAPSLEAVLERFFASKTACDLEGTMAHVAPDLRAYVDATLGWEFDSYEALEGVFAQYMPGWAPPARSYATKVLAGECSALIHVVDTPELFGGELRILAAVDFVDGKIVRWVDYWDGAAFDRGLYEQFRTPQETFPHDLKESQVRRDVAPRLADAATALQQAFAAGDASAAARLLHTDVALTDMPLRTQVVGRIQTERYLARVLPEVPYGRSSTLRHVVGGPAGGGFEWSAGSHGNTLVGITAVELDPDGLVTSITSVYDSRQVDPEVRRSLNAAALNP